MSGPARDLTPYDFDKGQIVKQAGYVRLGVVIGVCSKGCCVLADFIGEPGGFSAKPHALRRLTVAEALAALE